jgi:hypothetical protein
MWHYFMILQLRKRSIIFIKPKRHKGRVYQGARKVTVLSVDTDFVVLVKAVWVSACEKFS